jgi:hypothetical protein
VQPQKIQKHGSGGPCSRGKSQNVEAANRTTAGNPKTTVKRPEQREKIQETAGLVTVVAYRVYVY